MLHHYTLVYVGKDVDGIERTGGENESRQLNDRLKDFLLYSSAYNSRGLVETHWRPTLWKQKAAAKYEFLREHSGSAMIVTKADFAEATRRFKRSTWAWRLATETTVGEIPEISRSTILLSRYSPWLDQLLVACLIIQESGILDFFNDVKPFFIMTENPNILHGSREATQELQLGHTKSIFDVFFACLCVASATFVMELLGKLAEKYEIQFQLSMGKRRRRRRKTTKFVTFAFVLTGGLFSATIQRMAIPDRIFSEFAYYTVLDIKRVFFTAIMIGSPVNKWRVSAFSLFVFKEYFLSYDGNLYEGCLREFVKQTRPLPGMTPAAAQFPLTLDTVTCRRDWIIRCWRISSSSIYSSLIFERQRGYASRFAADAVVGQHDDKFWLSGGHVDALDIPVASVVEIRDGQSGEFKGPDLPARRIQHCLTKVDGDQVIMFGGYEAVADENGLRTLEGQNTAFIYSFKQNNWTRVSRMASQSFIASVRPLDRRRIFVSIAFHVNETV